MKSRLPILFLLLVLTFSIPSSATNNKKSIGHKKATIYEVRVHHNGQSPILDGILSKNEWKNAALITHFTQKEPYEGKPSSEPTFVLITYDDKNIYFGIRCYDKQPTRIVANEMRRDHDLSNNDYFEIIIDTYHDMRNAFYFATNSLGARLDSEIKSEGTYINWDWDGIWQCIARKDRYGWTAEVAIPFKTLRFKEGENLTWGINFGRYIARKREAAYWAPISRNDDFDSIGKFKVSKFGILRGLKIIKPGHSFQLKPYTIGGLEKNFETRNSLDKLGDIGLDTKVHITSNIISDITINTDFAQVEADQEQVNLSRFSLFFPEKRDFFIEGLDIFNVGEGSFSNPFTLLFFSRQIGLHRDNETFELKEVPILGGIKITGKEGPFEIGLLDVYTKELKYMNQNKNIVKIPATNYSALRIKKDIFQRSYVGFIGLSKDPLSYGNYNRTFAVDGLFSFNNNLLISGYYAKTKTPSIHQGDYNGYLDISWGTDKIYTRGTFTDIGGQFNPEMGFLQWRDIRKYNAHLTISPRPNISYVRQMHFTNDLVFITDHSNELQYRTIQTGMLTTFEDESYLFIGLTNYYDNVPEPGFYLGPTFIPGGIYKYNVFGFSYKSDRSRKIAGKIRIGNGSFYDGTFFGATVSSYFRPNNKFGLDFSWNWNRIEVPFVNGKFTTSILGTRFKYSFTPDLYAKLFIQWNKFENKIISNFLINFIHSPGSDFYLVYNEEWDTSGHIEPIRTVVAKITYLFNL